MNFWARTPLNLVADRVKNSVPPLLRTLRFCVGRQGGRIRQLQTLTSQAGQQTVQSLEAVCRDRAPGGARRRRVSGLQGYAKGMEPGSYTLTHPGSFRMTDHRPLPTLASHVTDPAEQAPSKARRENSFSGDGAWSGSRDGLINGHLQSLPHSLA